MYHGLGYYDDTMKVWIGVTYVINTTNNKHESYYYIKYIHTLDYEHSSNPYNDIIHAYYNRFQYLSLLLLVVQ